MNISCCVAAGQERENAGRKCPTMMLVKGTVVQLASMPGTHARCMTLLPLPRVCPGRGRLAFTSGSTDPKFIAYISRLRLGIMLRGVSQSV